MPQRPRRMRVALNVGPTLGRPTGIGVYVEELFGALARLESGHTYVRFPADEVQLARLAERALRKDTRRFRASPQRWRELAGELLTDAAAINGIATDIYHSTDGYLPLAPLRVPTVVTVHDMWNFRAPLERRGLLHRMRYRLLIARSAQRAARVICVSDFTRRELLELVRLDPRKVVTVPEAASDRFANASEAAGSARLQRYPELRRPYVLTVASGDGRKNLPYLLRGVAHAVRRGAPDLSLVVIGKLGRAAADLGALAEELGVAGAVRLIDYAGAEDLPLIYRTARLFCFPSRYEGFGIPILEAMQSGTPCVLADIPVFREVASTAAAYFGLDDVEHLAERLAQAWRSEEMRARLTAAGLQRAREFSWERTARETEHVYEEAAGLSTRSDRSGKRS